MELCKSQEINPFPDHNMPSIFEYTDYREFLLDYYKEELQKNSSFTFKQMNLNFGFTSNGFIKQVIDKKKNLSTKGGVSISQYLGFDTRSRSYFILLIKLASARTESSRSQFLSKIREFNVKNTSMKIDPKSTEVLFNRMCAVIIMMVKSYKSEFRLDPYWIHKRIKIETDIQTIYSAIQHLLKNGLITQDGDLVKVKRSFLSAGDGKRNKDVQGAHKMLLKEAADLIGSDIDHRDYFHCTFNFPDENVELLKQKVKEIKEDFLSWLISRQKEKKSFKNTRSYSFNFQLYPLFDPPKKKPKK